MAPTSISPLPSPNTAPVLTLETLLLDIPFELATHFDYGNLFQLKQTWRAFRSSLDPDSLLPRSYKLAFHQEVERFPCHRTHLACFKCFRLLSARQSFIDTRRIGPSGKYDKDPSRKS
ncbi:hypothetical protein QBC36DRAFT_292317 [Triangularia setosa]|uniref:F-box domain-containing protein n=1 Tax=Triangularia setosa TaxID=2587417 RepID=A0AAN6W386_9PEZI|nr:hypothetical protein QBC36DRAFT_292317 [Podospora setosa]